ncbi:hypothetical protein BJX96DRAFT_101999 [Aspergillus floccosus]
MLVAGGLSSTPSMATSVYAQKKSPSLSFIRKCGRSLQMSIIKSDVAFIVALLRGLLFVSFSFLFPRHLATPSVSASIDSTMCYDFSIIYIIFP